MGVPGRATSWATILVLVLLTGGAVAGSIATAPTGSRAVAQGPNYSHGSLSASPTTGSTSSIPPIATTRIPPGTLPCSEANLAADSGQFVQLAFGDEEVLTNTGTAPCAISGSPSVVLLQSNGSALPVTEEPPSKYDFLLEPGGSATLEVGWVNWCEGVPGPLRISITFSAGQTVMGRFGPFVNRTGVTSISGVPKCVSAGYPSTLTASFVSEQAAPPCPFSGPAPGDGSGVADSNATGDEQEVALPGTFLVYLWNQPEADCHLAQVLVEAEGVGRMMPASAVTITGWRIVVDFAPPDYEANDSPVNGFQYASVEVKPGPVTDVSVSGSLSDGTLRVTFTNGGAVANYSTARGPALTFTPTAQQAIVQTFDPYTDTIS
jgi:hypothetical protein